MLPESFKPGQRLSAYALNAIVEELKRLGVWSLAPPLGGSSGPEGISLSFGEPDGSIWIKLTAAGDNGAYAWSRQIAVTGGTWVDALGNQQGTATDDPAYESNENETVKLSPNPVVRAWRDPVSNSLLFTAAAC